MLSALKKGATIFFVLLVAMPMAAATRPRPLGLWVVDQERYMLRKTPGSFSLMLYVYGDPDTRKEVQRRKGLAGPLDDPVRVRSQSSSRTQTRRALKKSTARKILRD